MCAVQKCQKKWNLFLGVPLNSFAIFIKIDVLLKKDLLASTFFLQVNSNFSLLFDILEMFFAIRFILTIQSMHNALCTFTCHAWHKK